MDVLTMKLEAVAIEQIMSEWTKDSNVDSTEPGKEIIRIPILHNKYNKFLSAHNLAAKKIAIEYNKLRKLKWMYYNGKLSQEELDKYGWEQFPFVLKQDLAMHLEGDDDLTRLQAKKSYHEEAAAFCVNVMKELNNRTWQLKEYMSWEKFIHGQH
jgi:hypothetical protein